MDRPPQQRGPVVRALAPLRGRTATKVTMITPAIVLFVLFYMVPVVVGLGLSLFYWNGIDDPVWVGFENYRALFADDPVFFTNVKVTLIVVGVSLATVLPVALLLAVCLSGRGRLLPIFRWILFMPVVVPLAAVALLWSEIFNPADGLANRLIGTVGFEPVGWLGESGSALWALLLVALWSTVGFHIVIQLSALSAIPADLKEAARLETPSAWRMYRHVVLPLLRDSITVSAVLIISGAFVFFTSLSFIMTLGGPVHSTEVLGMRAYLEAFSNLDIGRASAVTVLTMLLTITLVGGALLLGSRRRVEY